MTTEMLIIAVVRLLGALPVLRWPFYGGIFALFVDQSDLFLMNTIELGGVRNYQAFDKYLDQAYLVAFLVVALRWRGAARNVAVALYAFRLLGFGVFELTDDRDVLLLFPNFFESWFLLVAAVQQFGRRGAGPLVLRLAKDERVLGVPLPLLLVALVALKLFQEYAIHYRRWLDGFTAVEAVEAIWRWLTPF